mmetsp:Transcript_7414/g.14010  ORF Transcript_7414/g.14010 Transcript_7414/m.14010 type:complete len:248 (-) Transcript_7414:267-1010(-)
MSEQRLCDLHLVSARRRLPQRVLGSRVVAPGLLPLPPIGDEQLFARRDVPCRAISQVIYAVWTLPGLSIALHILRVQRLCMPPLIAPQIPLHSQIHQAFTHPGEKPAVIDHTCGANGQEGVVSARGREAVVGQYSVVSYFFQNSFGNTDQRANRNNFSFCKRTSRENAIAGSPNTGPAYSNVGQAVTRLSQRRHALVPQWGAVIQFLINCNTAIVEPVLAVISKQLFSRHHWSQCVEIQFVVQRLRR